MKGNMNLQLKLISDIDLADLSPPPGMRKKIQLDSANFADAGRSTMSKLKKSLTIANYGKLLPEIRYS